MPFVPEHDTEACPICGDRANVYERHIRVPIVVNCSRCGDYKFESRLVADDAGLPVAQPERLALVCYLIRQLNGALIPASRGLIERPILTDDFFQSLSSRSLPSPAEATDNMLLYLAKQCGSRPGASLSISYADSALAPSVGVVDADDVDWLITNLESLQFFKGDHAFGYSSGTLTGAGWNKIAELRRTENASRFAFFARQFDNADLDTVYETCLLGAVRETGFELRPVTQTAGLVDAVIEDEIRRCSFVIADLSDANAGAYWEAGFAEGLGKPVIYLCKEHDDTGEKQTTHFDANHRHTVRWDLASLDRTATKLKAVIRNTLLGAAKQSDA